MADDGEALQRRLRALFSEELEDNIRILTEGLLRLEDAGAGAADVAELFRAAHGLKGAAHAAGVQQAVAICDRMESTFAAMRQGDLEADAAVVTALLADVDALQGVASSLRGGDAAPAADAGAAPAPQSRPGGNLPPPAPQRRRQDAPGGTVQALRPGAGTTSAPTSVRVSVDKLDALLATAGEALAAAQRLGQVSRGAADAAAAVDASRQRWRALPVSAVVAAGGPSHDLGGLLDDASSRMAALEQAAETAQRDLGHATSAVAGAAQDLRLQPIRDAWQGLERLVRDIAAGLGKQVRLVVHGGDVDVDRAVVAALREPLLHLARNAADHGLEPPEERIAAGKPPAGTVTISAELRQSMVALVVSDDGRGLDVAALTAVAERRGGAVPSSPVELAFLPGVSTSDEVSAVSGRGVGLDAVRADVEEVGGSVEVTSEPGAGTTFTIMAPTTLATMRVLVAEAAGEVACLPIAALERVTTVSPADLRAVEGRTVASVDGETRQVVSLAAALGVAGAEQDGPMLQVVLTRGGGGAFIADRFVEDLDVVVKPMPLRLSGALGALGVAVLRGGDPALVVSPLALLRAGTAGGPAVRQTASDRPQRARILLAEDTVTTRALERSILESAGYEVVVAVDGTEAWQLLQTEDVDLVVSDVQMPGLDGFQLCQAIRAATPLRDLPVVLVTSLATDEDRRRGAEAGADAYFVKSDFRQGGLLETIQRLL